MKISNERTAYQNFYTVFPQGAKMALAMLN
jgi:hypothetical protein